MFLKPELWARCARIGLLASGASLTAAVLAACGTGAAPTPAPQAARKTAVQTVFSTGNAPEASPSQPLPPAVTTNPPGLAAAAALPADEAVARILAYADRVRALSAAELAQEAARLGNASAPTPAAQLQLALVLAQLRQTPELIRAQELLTRVINSLAAEAQPLQPLARLLAARYGEQRRLEDLLDKQTQQTRDVQRRLDQTHERLEALKAIERSLTSRPPAAASSAPASRTRPAAP